MSGRTFVQSSLGGSASLVSIYSMPVMPSFSLPLREPWSGVWLFLSHVPTKLGRMVGIHIGAGS